MELAGVFGIVTYSLGGVRSGAVEARVLSCLLLLLDFASLSWLGSIQCWETLVFFHVAHVLTDTPMRLQHQNSRRLVQHKSTSQMLMFNAHVQIECYIAPSCTLHRVYV